MPIKRFSRSALHGEALRPAFQPIAGDRIPSSLATVSHQDERRRGHDDEGRELEEPRHREGSRFPLLIHRSSLFILFSLMNTSARSKWFHFRTCLR